MIDVICNFCGETTQKTVSHFNRSVKNGALFYCNKKCFGQSERANKTGAQKKEEKRLYDIEYRKKNAERIKRRKAEQFKKNYDPVEAAKARAQKNIDHPEWEQKRRAYMRKEEYKAAKKRYDRIYRAKKDYGEEWGECMVLALDIRDECLSQASDYEIRLQAGTLNKAQHRKRDYERSNSNKSEIGSLGNPG